MSLEALIYGVRVFWRQLRCNHDDEMVRASVLVAGGKWIPVRKCERCGWTDLNPLVW